MLLDDIDAGLALLPAKMRSPAARVLLYATNRQENPTRSPRQIVKVDGRLQPIGPAAGDYQFEKGGGVKGVLTHPASSRYAQACCFVRDVLHSPDDVFKAIQTDPVLAAALARLLYYTDPKALPALGDEQGNWELYLRTWRPGAYARQPDELRAKWAKSYADAMKANGY